MPMVSSKKQENNDKDNIQSSDEIDESVEEVDQTGPKKRGRKPKNKVVEVVAESVTPKKRGRRPKDKTYAVISNYKEIPAEVEDDNIILHLPVEMENTENDMKIDTSGVLKYDPNLKEPIPYEPMDSMRSGFALISEKLQERLNDVDEIVESEERVVTRVEKSVGKLESDEVYMRDIGFEEDTKDYFKVLKKAKILKMIESEKTKKEWDLFSDRCCFYCTEKFETVPIGIPVKYFRGKFHCRDNFCSFNCAAAYIFRGGDIQYQFKKWEYYSLLCLMAWKIQKEICDSLGQDKKNISMKVKLAEDRNLLKKYGGPLTIDQFRRNYYILDKEYSIHYPPLSSMYPQTEVAHYVNIHRQKAQMLNNDSRYSYGENRSGSGDLRLKRDKPLIQKNNTLEQYMSLKIN